MAILTSMILHDEEGLAAVAGDMPCPHVLAYLARASELVVNVLAQTLGVTKEEALRICAQAVAAADQDE